MRIRQLLKGILMSQQAADVPAADAPGDGGGSGVERLQHRAAARPGDPRSEEHHRRRRDAGPDLDLRAGV